MLQHLMEILINRDKDFFRTFKDNETCIKYLELKRWNNIPTCTRCNNNHNNYYLKNRKEYECSKCKKQFTVLQGTIFHKTKVELENWFYAIYLVATSKKRISSISLSEKIGVQQRTAWLMLHKIRETMKDENTKRVLSGIVECDEAYVGSKPNRDQRLKKRMDDYQIKHNKPYEHLKGIFGAIERESGLIVLRKFGYVQNCFSKKMAKKLLQKHVTPDSTINSDNHKAYKQLKHLFQKHDIINKHREVTRKKKDGTKYKLKVTSFTDGKIHVNGIENVWKQLKIVVIGTFHHFSYKHTDRYLNEYAYIWNRKKMNFSYIDILEDIIQNSFDKMITYDQLIRWDKNYQVKPWMI